MGDLQSVNDMNDAVASSDVHPLWVDCDVFVIKSAWYLVDAGILELPDNTAIAVERACAAHTAQKPQQDKYSSTVSSNEIPIILAVALEHYQSCSTAAAAAMAVVTGSESLGRRAGEHSSQAQAETSAVTDAQQPCMYDCYNNCRP